jgi:hypothetical protein
MTLHFTTLNIKAYGFWKTMFFYVLFLKLPRIASVMPFDKKGLSDPTTPTSAPSKKSHFGISWMG